MTNNSNPILLNPAKGKEILVGNSKVTLKLASEATSNKLSITEYELPPKFPGPPPHKHKVFEHAWYVLEGELTVQLDQETLVLSKGSFLFIPKMTVHAFSNNSKAVVKVFVVDTPGGFENYYFDLQAAFGDSKAVNQEVIQEIQQKYDTYPPNHIW